MPTHKRGRSPITRSGARRLGDDYQDVVALEMLVDWLEHSERYEWVQVEANDVGVLDDVVARKRDGTRVCRQIKFAVHPDDPGDPWTWETLLSQKTGANGHKLSSLLQDWASSLQRVTASEQPVDAALYSNRSAAYEISQALIQEGGTLLDFTVLSVARREEIITQLGSEERAIAFFQQFRFLLNQPNLADLDAALWRRFSRLGGTHHGWLSLKDELRSWVCHRNDPPPDGIIRLTDVRRAALWHELEGLAQEYTIPADYVPPQGFLRSFGRKVLQPSTNCLVLSGSPGVGKSTFISYLYAALQKKNIPTVRHHYYLGTNDHTPGFRLDHLRAAESLMYDLARDHASALGSLLGENPQPTDLRNWLITCGKYYAEQGKALTVMVDGLDHVWREQHSIDELTHLLNYLLPSPEGVMLIFATQPVDDRQLPPVLLRHAPRADWVQLPQLDQPAVEQWVHRHISDFPEQERQLNADGFIERLAKALYRKGNGHPLHLRYTLKAIQERNLAFTEETITALPGCPHAGITAYYDELWRALSEGSRAVMHLLAAAQFPWSSQGIIDCIDPDHQQISRIRDDLRQVKHLLVDDDIGLHPFHSSIFVFVTQLPEHQDYCTPHLQKALNWLRQVAPDYWRWAYTWQVESRLGNDVPLSQGPNRQWVIDALVARQPSQDIIDLLRSSMDLALHNRDLPRLVELGLLHDYGNVAHEFHRNIRSQLLYSQLALEDHPSPSLRAWLFADLDDVTDSELVLLAEDARERDDIQAFNRCRETVAMRLQRNRQHLAFGSHPSWQQRLTPQLAMAAISDDVCMVNRILSLVLKNRRRGCSQEILSLYCERLRAWRNIDHLRTLLALPITGTQARQVPQEKAALTVEEVILLRRHTIFLALEEGMEIDELFSSDTTNDPLVALYANFRQVPEHHSNVFHLPSRKLSSLQWPETFEHSFELRELFYQAFSTICSGLTRPRWI